VGWTVFDLSKLVNKINDQKPITTDNVIFMPLDQPLPLYFKNKNIPIGGIKTRNKIITHVF
jgi:hypothetical protein